MAPTSAAIPPDIEDYRDVRWWREASRQVATPLDAERFVEHVGFAACLTDARRPGPSLFVAVCGRRDAVMPRHPQKDHEASLTWHLKDALLRRGKVYYAKLGRGKTMFIAPRLVPCFHAIWGVRRADEARRLSAPARKILAVLRHEWEMGTADLRAESGLCEQVERATERERNAVSQPGRRGPRRSMKDAPTFSRALDELQAAMLVIPADVVDQPFTYIWTLGVGRFPDELRRRMSRDAALKEIARCFLTGAGLTVPGELARVIGISRHDAGRGNRALVAEGFATMLSPGKYRLKAST